MSATQGPFGVVWANEVVEIAQTGYVFDTPEQAAEVGHNGLNWFYFNQVGEIDDAVGTQVDWTVESGEAPTGFWVDTETENENVWHDADFTPVA